MTCTKSPACKERVSILVFGYQPFKLVYEGVKAISHLFGNVFPVVINTVPYECGNTFAV